MLPRPRLSVLVLALASCAQEAREAELATLSVRAVDAATEERLSGWIAVESADPAALLRLRQQDEDVFHPGRVRLPLEGRSLRVAPGVAWRVGYRRSLAGALAWRELAPLEPGELRDVVFEVDALLGEDELSRAAPSASEGPRRGARARPLRRRRARPRARAARARLAGPDRTHGG